MVMAITDYLPIRSTMTGTCFVDCKIASTHIELKGDVLSQYKTYVKSIRENHQAHPKTQSDLQQVNSGAGGSTVPGET